MRTRADEASPFEKQRMRDEIEEQIAFYLARGGKIDVLTAKDNAQRTVTAPWQDLDHPLDIG